MPYSPIPKFPQIFNNLRNRNFTHQVGLEQLRVEIMRVTGSMKAHTITEIVKAMVDLGYIRDTGHGGIFYIYQDKTPYNFPQDKSKEIDEDDELKKYEQSG